MEKLWLYDTMGLTEYVPSKWDLVVPYYTILYNAFQIPRQCYYGRLSGFGSW